MGVGPCGFRAAAVARLPALLGPPLQHVLSGARRRADARRAGARCNGRCMMHVEPLIVTSGRASPIAAPASREDNAWELANALVFDSPTHMQRQARLLRSCRRPRRAVRDTCRPFGRPRDGPSIRSIDGPSTRIREYACAMQAADATGARVVVTPAIGSQHRRVSCSHSTRRTSRRIRDPLCALIAFSTV
ncbi:hypothetical protein THICB2_640063 [Thiomonas sp. CB2]|nr:hypothetical protein THICB2_640063 [Thiomonas sp. CB2]